MLLNLHSYYSLRYGTLSIDQLTDAMIECGYDTAVLTDINNSSAVLEFIMACQKKNLTGLAGMEFRKGNELLYIGIARNEKGFRELNEWMTQANRDRQSVPEFAPRFHHTFVIYPYGKKEIRFLYDNEYIGIRADQLSRITLEPAIHYERYVMLAPVTFYIHRSGPEIDLRKRTHWPLEFRKSYKLHCQLRAIDHNLLISQLNPTQVGGRDEFMIPKNQLIQKYKGFPQLIQNTIDILSQCQFNFNPKAVRNKKTFTENVNRDHEILHMKAMDGLYRRYGADHKEAKIRVLEELNVIRNLNFSAYFLITDDICEYARSRGFHYVGRGSGANSVVAYCLGITDVDPIKLGLYFERFLNPKRKVPPDFDIDFAWNERDEIYTYIFKKYEHTALMGAMSTFHSRSIIRELGKVYGLPKGEIDRLVHEPTHVLNKNEVVEMIQSVYGQLVDFPNQRTIHASGVLISEEPLTCYTALDYPPKGLPTVQFDMYTAEDISFEKFDILSQRGIGHIKDCVKIVQQNRGETISTDHPHRFFDDERIKEQLRSAQTIGCFYIESPAMRQLLTKLRCDEYLTLVAASSIIRPGVASSGMMKAYIERHHSPEAVEYLHPVMKEQLEETYGVMVYQEDVMKIGHHYGGLDLADADVLRRMMSGKYRHASHMLEIRDKFFLHCQNQGYDERISSEIWRQMESFAGYSFNKAHSASFAVESYQSLYLKTYYPLEFMVAVLNNYGGFYQRKVYVTEARRAGGTICLPCVNKSQFNTSIDGTLIYLGFDCLLNLEHTLAETIPKERIQKGPYTSLENFIIRTGARLEQLIILIRCGAFRFTDTGKKELLWEAHLLFSQHKAPVSTHLFDGNARRPVLPALETSLLEDLYDELELIGFTVSDTMFALVKSPYRGETLAANLGEYEGKTIRMVGEFVADKYVRTRNGSTMKFGTFFDTAGNFFDTVHFPNSLQAYPLYGNGVYLMEGKVVLDFGCAGLEVNRIARMPIVQDPRSE